MAHTHRVPSAEFLLAQVLDGNAWQLTGEAEGVTLSTPKYIQLKTGELEVIITIVELIATGDDIKAFGLKGPTVIADGSPLPLVNKNDLFSSKLPALQAFDNPTVTNRGSTLGGNAAYGSNQTPQRFIRLADVARGDVYVLKPNSSYLFEITSSGTSNVFFSLNCVESNYFRDAI
jgi:hypothetical protein